ncbi:hypothetical protein D918_09797 [Trichuris suis]|nr:hypothetical protein D918_09797 [Trichuris suis]
MDNWQPQSNNGCDEMQLDKDNCQCVVVRSASKNRRRLQNVGTATSSSSSRTDNKEEPIAPLECQQSCQLHSDKHKCVEEQSHLSLPTVERDSGTESDEELELIETNSMTSVAVSQTSDYYASQPSWSISSCHSVVGSPVCCALNDQDLNW